MGDRMRILATTTAALAMTVISAVAAEPQAAFNNLAHEYATCAAYFGVVSVALENSSEPATAAIYAKLMGQALEYAATTGELIGLLPETAGARFNNSIVEMEARIGGNTSNISILFSDYREQCTAAMEDPEARIAHWMAE